MILLILSALISVYLSYFVAAKDHIYPLHYSTVSDTHLLFSSNNSINVGRKKFGLPLYETNFVHPLMETITNYSQPILADCIVIFEEDVYTIWSVISLLNLPPTTSFRIHANYTLEYNGLFYYNKMKSKNTYENIQILHYSIPCSNPKSYIQIHLHDREYGISYTANMRVLGQPSTQMKVGVCAYVSDYNKDYEIRSWIAYYSMMGVDTLMLYSAVPLPHVQSLFRKVIDSGFVRWYDFHWPLNNYHKKIQRSLQLAQVNSCYYRHRHEFEYLVMIDIDEYVLSEEHPFDLYASIKNQIQDEADVHILTSNMYKANSVINREFAMKYGMIFDIYNCWLDNKRTGRKKMIIDTQSHGYYGIHECVGCNMTQFEPTDLHIFHLSKNIPLGENNFTCINKQSELSSPLKKVLSTI